jgi:glutathione S-transferase
MLLHSFFITPNNRKVEVFIKHFDLDVDIHQVNFREQENKTDEFLAMNPMGKVPVLVDGDLNLWESNAILTYLATMFPQTHALPTDPKGRADVDRWLHWQSSHLMPAIGKLKTGRDDADGVCRVAGRRGITALTAVIRTSVLSRQFPGISALPATVCGCPLTARYTCVSVNHTVWRCGLCYERASMTTI